MGKLMSVPGRPRAARVRVDGEVVDDKTQPGEFLYAHREQVSRKWHLQRHVHSHHELVVVVSGSERAAFADATLSAHSGEALFFPAGQTHEEWASNETPMARFVVGFSWSAHQMGMPRMVRDYAGRLLGLATWLYQERQAAFSAAHEFRNALVRALLAEYQRLCDHCSWGSPRSLPGSPIVESVQGFVNSRLSEPFTLDDLARHVGMSKYYLVRSYRSLTGLTPMDHARLIRLEAARRLLVTTSLPLRTIAPRVGFASEYHLSRLLRSRLGVGARELRRKAVAS